MIGDHKVYTRDEPNGRWEYRGPAKGPSDAHHWFNTGRYNDVRIVRVAEIEVAHLTKDVL